MFKRIFWMGTGMAVGASGAFWAKRKVTQTVETYLPEQVAERAAASARGLGATVRQAAAEGRATMRLTEAELRARAEDRTFVGKPATTDEPEAGASPAAPVRRAARPARESGTGAAGRRRARR